MVAGAELLLAGGSAGGKPSIAPCSIKRCQFPRQSALGIHHQAWTLLSAYLSDSQSVYLGTYRASESRI